MEHVMCGSLDALSACAASFLGRLRAHPDRATVVALSGDLGAGKTAFVKMLARHLGIEEHVTSPTFVLQKTYPIPVPDSPFPVPGFSTLTHVDAYRLERGEEMRPLGWDETLATPQSLVVIEWPERIENAVPKDAAPVHFKWIDGTTREVIFEKHD